MATQATAADGLLAGREAFGIKLGLERMRALLRELGDSQAGLPAIHVVGTNGKSSTARMAAALLEAHGTATGTILSPHLRDWTERVRLRDADIEAAAWNAAVERAEAAAQAVDSTLDGDRVTQFEVATAASLLALRDADVEAAVVEAGLGGRHDATNVLESRVVVLTSVGLDHTEHLGDTLDAIAREKLAVLRTGTTLVAPEDLPREAAREARVAAEATGSELLVAPGEVPGVELRARGAFQRRNFALACAAAEAFLPEPLDPLAVRRAAAAVAVPGRFERIGDDPLTILDAAHNPAGAAALAEELSRLGTPVTLVLAMLRDKDVEGIVAALAPRAAALVATQTDSPRALAAGEVAALARAAGVGDVVVEPDPPTALERARGAGRTVVATGSITLAGALGGPDR